MKTSITHMLATHNVRMQFGDIISTVFNTNNKLAETYSSIIATYTFQVQNGTIYLYRIKDWKYDACGRYICVDTYIIYSDNKYEWINAKTMRTDFATPCWQDMYYYITGRLVEIRTTFGVLNLYQRQMHVVGESGQVLEPYKSGHKIRRLEYRKL